MAEVYRARYDGEAGFAKELVIKKILPSHAEDARFVDMFLNEARLAARLSHANIVHVFDFGSVEGQYYLAMEFVPGLTLRRIRSVAQQSNNPIPIRHLARIACGICEGLHYAHTLCDDDGRALEIIHRDVSPDNIIVSRTGIPKLLDFGIAKANIVAATTQGTLKGKYAYMSPEQLKGEVLDHRVDVYALGVVLYELITGQKPFSGTDAELFKLLEQIIHEDPPAMHELRPIVPEGMELIVQRAMEKKPEHRYATAREMRVALEHFLAATGSAVLEFHIANYLDEVVVSSKEGNSLAFERPFATPVSVVAGSLPALEDDETPTTIEHAPAARMASLPPERAKGGKPPAAARPKRSRGLILGIGAGIAVAGIALAFALTRGGADSKDGVVAPPPAVLAAAQPDAGATTVVSHLVPPDAGILGISPPGALPPDAGPREPDASPRKVRARLSVRSSPWCDVYLGRRKIGATPINGVEVRAGRHRLRCINRHKGFKTDRRIELTAGRHRTETFRFRKGTLAIRVRPWGKVTVDGQKKGSTPLAPFSAWEGSHEITVTNSDLGVTRTVRVRVVGGKTKTVRIDLTK